jgi:hypothetical protein
MGWLWMKFIAIDYLSIKKLVFDEFQTLSGISFPKPDLGQLLIRVDIPWLGHTCQHCRYCLSEKENLGDTVQFTGYDLKGGYAEYVACDDRFCFPIPEGYPDLQAAPLLCAGLIGYRFYKWICCVGDQS